MMTNLEIRLEMTRLNLKQWQVASILGISESVFSRKLRKEMTEEEKKKIIEAMQTRG